jgi:hypothetical protein
MPGTTTSLIPVDAFLLTESGPALTESLRAGEDSVWQVDRNGSLVLAAVTGKREMDEQDCWRILTPAGDIVVPDGTLLMTSEGPLSGVEIVDLVERDRVVRVDVVASTDLPKPKPKRASENAVLRSCLRELPNGLIQLPRANGVADELADEIEDVLARADVSYTVCEHERWVALLIDDVVDDSSGGRAQFRLQADVLAMLTAWVAHDDHYESRVRLEDHRLLLRLVAALVGAARPFEVKWLPAYRPVEARIRILDDRQWPARVPVIRAAFERAATLELSTSLPGDLVVNLAILSTK